MSALTTEFKSKIEKKIEEIESKCSLEIVPVISKRSSYYWKTRLVLSGLIFGALLLTLEFYPSWKWTFEAELFICASLSLFVFLLSFWPYFLRMYLPEFIQAEAVKTEAEAIYISEKLVETKKKTGILIFVAEFERKVWVLADKGLVEAFPDYFFSELGQKLAIDFNHRSPGETFMKALEELSNKIPEQLKGSDSHNELSNKIREH